MQRFCKVCRKWHDMDAPWPDECAGHYATQKTNSLQVIRDIAPYKSMIDGSMITSRSRHREHLKSHGCIELGNEAPVARPKPVYAKENRRKALSQQLADMSDRQANKILKQLKKELHV